MQKDINIIDIFIYPIKSTYGLRINESVVEKTGLKHDRALAVINSKNQVLTARENSKLLEIKASFNNSLINLKSLKENHISFDLDKIQKHKIEAKIFGIPIRCLTIDDKVDKWISNILNQKSQLVVLDSEKPRFIKSKYCKNENNAILFTDVSPIHLISKESLDDLNKRLENRVEINTFRPNIYISGCTYPYEEDTWKTIRIGDCEFEVLIQTKRCSFTSINPETREKDKKQKILKKLAEYRTKEKNINFGVYLIPRKLGNIKIEDKIKIITTVNTI